MQPIEVFFSALHIVTSGSSCHTDDSWAFTVVVSPPTPSAGLSLERLEQSICLNQRVMVVRYSR